MLRGRECATMMSRGFEYLSQPNVEADRRASRMTAQLCKQRLFKTLKKRRQRADTKSGERAVASEMTKCSRTAVCHLSVAKGNVLGSIRAARSRYILDTFVT